MKIQWLGHSCFRLSHQDYTLVLDPYKRSRMLRLKSMHTKANEVLCSHQHSDHNYLKAVEIEDTTVKSPFQIKQLETYHDDHKGKMRGKNLITIIETDDFKVAHLGDLGCSLNESQIHALQNLDALMIPVGGFFTIGPEAAKEICDLLQPKVIIPMHYKGKKFGPIMLSKLDDFLSLFNQKHIEVYKENHLTLEDVKKEQIAVLPYKG